MGLRTNQANGNQGLDLGQALLQSGSPEMEEAPASAAGQPEALSCPRCGSTNTKFCYYNNYNKSQPRHFCKSCKRHWTKGGTLRNVPVGGCRKNKRPRIISSSAAKSAAAANVCPNFTQLGANNPAGDRKGGIASILYQALIRSSPSTSPVIDESMDGANISIPPGKDSTAKYTKEKTIDSRAPGTIRNPSPAADRNPNLEFQLANFEMDGSLIPATYEPAAINTYYMESMEESAVTRLNMDYLELETGNCSSMNYWKWSEMEALRWAEDLNISWEEEEEEVVVMDMESEEEEKVKVKP